MEKDVLNKLSLEMNGVGIDTIVEKYEQSIEDPWARCHNARDERIILRHLMYNYGKSSFLGNLKHYTRKTTLSFMLDYVKTYFRK